jgi:Tfp pilus assembly protein PilX
VIRRQELHPLASVRQPGRRGAYTIVVLVCLLISTMILLSLLKIVLLHDRQLGREGMRLQANWLADAGLERGADHLAAGTTFTGETWKIDASRLGGRDPATVTIRIDAVENQPHQRLVVVEAVYPADGPEQARVTRQATVTLKQE